jgi:hypothetical protein
MDCFKNPIRNNRLKLWDETLQKMVAFPKYYRFLLKGRRHTEHTNAMRSRPNKAHACANRKMKRSLKSVVERAKEIDADEKIYFLPAIQIGSYS